MHNRYMWLSQNINTHIVNAQVKRPAPIHTVRVDILMIVKTNVLSWKKMGKRMLGRI